MKIKYGVTVKGVGLYADVDGLSGLRKAIAESIEQSKDAAIIAINECAFDLKEKAVQRAPIDTSALRASGFVDEATSERPVATIGLGYEGSPPLVEGHASPEKYALRQHEELTWKHPNGGEPKFLENPFKENVDSYVKRIGKTAGKEVDGS
jgi:hypothetical protein